MALLKVWTSVSDAIREMTVFGTTGKSTRSCRRITIAPGTSSRSTCSLCIVVIRATGATTWRRFHCWCIGRTFWPCIGVAWVVGTSFNVWFIRVWIIRRTAAAVLTGSFGTEVQAWSLRIFCRIYLLMHFYIFLYIKLDSFMTIKLIIMPTCCDFLFYTNFLRKTFWNISNHL